MMRCGPGRKPRLAVQIDAGARRLRGRRPTANASPQNRNSSLCSTSRSTDFCEDKEHFTWRARGWSRVRLAGLGVSVAAAVVAGAHGGPAWAADFVKTGGCVLSKCQLELASCLGDEKCLENLVCLNSCAKCPSDEEAACQIKCGDLYNDKAIAAFNTCAVTNKSCVPQKMDNGMYMEPPSDVLVPEFDTSMMEGRWYITAGLNPLFDTFDCQVTTPSSLCLSLSLSLSLSGESLLLTPPLPVHRSTTSPPRKRAGSTPSSSGA